MNYRIRFHSLMNAAEYRSCCSHRGHSFRPLNSPHFDLQLTLQLTCSTIAAILLTHITMRTLDIDAAFLENSRTDLRYIIVEMHTCNNTIVPLCFHLCFGENTPSYEDMWDCLLSYNTGHGCLRDLIDNPSTRLNGDRNSSLRAAVESIDPHLQIESHCRCNIGKLFRAAFIQ